MCEECAGLLSLVVVPAAALVVCFGLGMETADREKNVDLLLKTTADIVDTSGS